ncbi:unnamed protein product, partial [marine sediment metagenome]
EFAGPLPCAPQSGGAPTLAELAWQPQSLSGNLLPVWGTARPRLVWYPGLPGPPYTVYNIYRSQVSTGPFDLVAARVQPGFLPVAWIDYGTDNLHGEVYYEVTFYDPGNDFESLPSSAAGLSLP